MGIAGRCHSRPPMAERGERQKARDLLAPVYGWFTEGFDTPDLIEPKHLVDALA
jgi:hypothetical protein